jgi:hypothetical protein
VAAVLGSWGPAAREALPALHEALNDDNGEVRLEVGRALNAIGPGDE